MEKPSNIRWESLISNLRNLHRTCILVCCTVIVLAASKESVEVYDYYIEAFDELELFLQYGDQLFRQDIDLQAECDRVDRSIHSTIEDQARRYGVRRRNFGVRRVSCNYVVDFTPFYSSRVPILYSDTLRSQRLSVISDEIEKLYRAKPMLILPKDTVFQDSLAALFDRIRRYPQTLRAYTWEPITRTTAFSSRREDKIRLSLMTSRDTLLQEVPKDELILSDSSYVDYIMRDSTLRRLIQIEGGKVNAFPHTKKIWSSINKLKPESAKSILDQSVKRGPEELSLSLFGINLKGNLVILGGKVAILLSYIFFLAHLYSVRLLLRDHSAFSIHAFSWIGIHPNVIAETITFLTVYMLPGFTVMYLDIQYDEYDAGTFFLSLFVFLIGLGALALIKDMMEYNDKRRADSKN